MHPRCAPALWDRKQKVLEQPRLEGTLKDHLVQPHPLDVNIQQPTPWHSESLQCQGHHHISGETYLVILFFSPVKICKKKL